MFQTREHRSPSSPYSQIYEFSTQLGINIEKVKEHELEKRPGLVINSLITQDEIESFVDSRNNNQSKKLVSGEGISLIKPEIEDEKASIVSFLDDLGCRPRLLDKVYPTHEQWMQTYGYVLKDHPEVIFLYLIQRSLGISPLLFNYLKTEDYSQSLCNNSKNRQDDFVSIFDQVFCGQVHELSPGTIRWEVVRPIVFRKGFDVMRGFAESFDIAEYFKYKNPISNLRAFNGVHLPSDLNECQRNIATFRNTF